MSLIDCPKCGAKAFKYRVLRKARVWACGSYAGEDGHIRQSRRCECGMLLARIRELEAERAELPTFADDRIAYPGMKGWYPGESEPGIVGETGLTCGNEEWGADVQECYSTFKAAEAAKANKQ